VAVEVDVFVTGGCVTVAVGDGMDSNVWVIKAATVSATIVENTFGFEVETGCCCVGTTAGAGIHDTISNNVNPLCIYINSFFRDIKPPLILAGTTSSRQKKTGRNYSVL